MRILNERTAFKILVDGQGAMLSLTTKKRAYFLFVTGIYVGMKVAPTTDPYPGIVEISDYDIAKILKNWSRMYRVKLT
jgi:hypothetical protein